MIRLARLALALALALGSAAASAQPTAEAERGQRLYNKCKACHQVGPNAKNRVGPHLNDVFGRRAGALEGFRFSKAMQAAGEADLIWDEASLDQLIAAPKKLVPKTRMSFRGLENAEDRAAIVAYLRQYSPGPSDIPEAPPLAHAASEDPPVAPEILAIEGDTAYGEYLAAECVTCHQASGEDKGIPSITGWPTEPFVTVMHAYKNKIRPNPVMQQIAGTLGDEEIAALAAYFETLNQ